MKYIVEESLADFEAWLGGKDTLDNLFKHGMVDKAEQYIEEVTRDYDTLPTQTEINNILWFDRGEIYKYCGIFNEVYDIDDEEEEED